MSLLVVGFGSALQGDDGAGPAVVARLRELALPPDVHLEDGGTDAIRLASCWNGEHEVWLVDALRTGAQPGTVHHLEDEDIFAIPQRSASAHELSLPECLGWLRIAFPAMAGVRWRIWGIEPECLGREQGLSTSVAWAVDRVAADIHARALDLSHESGRSPCASSNSRPGPITAL
jgi:hydrogenase maturation protease